MSKTKQKIDKKIGFVWDLPCEMEKVLNEKVEIREKGASGPAKARRIENEFELCVVIATGIKKAVGESGMSREQMVDHINIYFRRSKDEAARDDRLCRNPLTIHMFNNYLSKPAEYPIPAYYLFAIHHVTKSLEPAKVLVEAEGAKIATGQEIRQLALGKLEDHIIEINRLKDEIRGRR